MKKYFAEFLGTAILVFMGCGSAVGANAMFSAMGMLPAAFTTLSTAVAFGLALFAVTYVFGGFSGAHVNPAVSLAMLISGKLKLKDFFGYVLGQMTGGIAGAALLAVVIGGTASLFANGYDSASTFSTSVWMAMLLEVALTFIFVLVILRSKEGQEGSAVSAAAAGFALTLVNLFGVPFTGTSVNPARSFGPALLQGEDALSQVWVFIVAPLAGAILAALTEMLLKSEPRKRKRASVCAEELALSGACTEEDAETTGGEEQSEESGVFAESGDGEESGEESKEESFEEEK